MNINTAQSSHLLPIWLDANIQFISPEYAGYYIVSTFQYYAREILK